MRRWFILLSFGWIGCADASVQHAADIYRHAPGTIEALRDTLLSHLGDSRVLELRHDHLARDSFEVWETVSPEAHASQVDLSPSVVARVLQDLKASGARGVRAVRSDTGRYVEVWTSASGISISGCTTNLVYGRRPQESTTGNPVTTLRLPDEWFAEEACT